MCDANEWYAKPDNSWQVANQNVCLENIFFFLNIAAPTFFFFFFRPGQAGVHIL